MTSTIKKPALSPWPSSRLWGQKIHVLCLYTYYRQFANKTKEKFWDKRL